MTVVPLGINIVTDSARSGVRDLDALVPAAQRVERAVDKMSASVAQDLRAIEGGAQGASKGFASLGGGQIQNVAFQVGDFATQVGAGTSASVALAMQLPQLLGGFGALGAVLGAVVAIGVPVASAFIGAGDGAQIPPPPGPSSTGTRPRSARRSPSCTRRSSRRSRALRLIR